MQTHIFNSQIPVSFREDGFLNATAIASHFGKRPADYLKIEQTQEYISALAEFLSVTKKIVTEQNQIVISRRGGNEQGTWLHPKLAVHFARWLDAKFAVWCDMKIEEILGINQAQPDTRINATQKQQIQDAVRERHHRTGEHWQEIYRKLHALLKVNSYHEIQAADFQTALNFLASIPNAPAKPKKPEPQTPPKQNLPFAEAITVNVDKNKNALYQFKVQDGRIVEYRIFEEVKPILSIG